MTAARRRSRPASANHSSAQLDEPQRAAIAPLHREVDLQRTPRPGALNPTTDYEPHSLRSRGRQASIYCLTMEYTHLGRSGLEVSRLCLGTMNFGPQASEAESHSLMDRAIEAGINYFDTANVYGWEQGRGTTEQIIGRWFAQGGERREKVVLATKLYGSMTDWPNDTFLSARNIRRACDASLQRLQTDWIDIYQMHHVDRSTPWEEIWEAFSVL